MALKCKSCCLRRQVCVLNSKHYLRYWPRVLHIAVKRLSSVNYGKRAVNSVNTQTEENHATSSRKTARTYFFWDAVEFFKQYCIVTAIHWVRYLAEGGLRFLERKTVILFGNWNLYVKSWLWIRVNTGTDYEIYMRLDGKGAEGTSSYCLGKSQVRYEKCPIERS